MMGRPSKPVHPGVILAICCSSLLVVSMDLSMITVALPAIGRDLHSSITGLQWTVDAYTLVIASLLVLGGSLADRLGRRRIFQLGLTIFTIGSLLCSLAPTVELLVVARIVQALGGAMLNPVALSIITTTFTEPRARGRAVGVWGAVTGVSFGLGPLVGGALTQSLGWRSIFWVNLPIGIAAFILAALLIPESRAQRVRRIDPFGQVAVILFLASLVFGLIEAPELGWGSIAVTSAFGVSVVSIAVLLVGEHRSDHPLIDLRFFRSAPFSAAFVIAVTVYGAWNAFLFAIALILQYERGFTPLQAGLCTAAAGFAMLVLSPLSGAIAGSRGPFIPLLTSGIGVTAAGVLLATQLTGGTPVVVIVLISLLFGAGFAMANPTISNIAVSGMPVARAGAAAAIASTARQVGASIGVAIVGSIIGIERGAHASGFASHAVALWWIIAGVGVLVIVAAFALISRRALESAERVRPLLEVEHV